MKTGIYIGPGCHSNTFGKVVVDGADVGIDNHGDRNKFGTVVVSGCETAVSVKGDGNSFDEIIVAERGLAEAIGALPADARNALFAELGKATNRKAFKKALTAHSSIWAKAKAFLSVGGDLSSVAQFILALKSGF